MKKLVWVVLAIVSLVLASCGPAMLPATEATTANGEVFTVALPRIVVNFDSVGNPTVLGFGFNELARVMPGLQPTRLDPTVIDRMTATDVQHIELRQTGNGIVVFVNGKAMPFLGWSDESLQQMSELLNALYPQNTQLVSTVRKFLPIVRRLGIDLVLTFPRREGASEIALADPNEVVKAVAVPSTEPASAVVKFEVKYDENGVPGILGITAADLAAMGIPNTFALSRDTLRQIQAYNVQNIELRSKGDGVFLYVNGNPLPNIAWDDKLLTNTVDLWLQMNPTASQYGIPVDLLKQYAPTIARADIGVMIHFPVAQGQTPIVAKMH